MGVRPTLNSGKSKAANTFRPLDVCGPVCRFWGWGWQNIPNTFPADAGITSRDLLAFMIFWIIQFPFMFIHPVIMRWLYLFKGVYTPVCLFGVLGWAVQKNGGLGNITGLGSKHAEGSDLVWGMILAINSVLAVSLSVQQLCSTFLIFVLGSLPDSHQCS